MSENQLKEIDKNISWEAIHIATLLLEAPCFADHESYEDRFQQFVEKARIFQDVIDREDAEEKAYRKRIEDGHVNQNP